MRADYTDDEGPIVSKRELPMPSNFVTPAPLATRRPQVIDAPAWLVSREQLPIAGAWESQHGAREATSAMDRAQALRVRLQPFLWAWAGVGVVVFGAVWLVAGALPHGAILGALSFALLTAITYVRLNGQDYSYSREGTEQLRITEAAQLQREAMRHEQELRRMALESYLKQLDGKR